MLYDKFDSLLSVGRAKPKYQSSGGRKALGKAESLEFVDPKRYET
jgi:hypothetical protein